MKRHRTAGGFPPPLLREEDSDRHIKEVLESFASRLDNEIQAELISETMERYLEVSQQLERKTRQLELSDANRREAQEIAQLGNWEMGTAGEIWWSDSMSRVLELDPREAPSLDRLTQRIHPEDLPVVEQVLMDMVEGTVLPEIRFRLLLGDGRIKWVQNYSRAILDQAGRLVSIRGTTQDITRVKMAEEKLQEYNERLEDLVREKVAEVSQSQLAIIYALVNLAESRDDDTGDHIQRTAQYCRLLAQRLWEHREYPHQVDRDFIESITQASPLHDIGKVGIPDAILLKPGKLTPEEMQVMKTHVLIGHQTLAGVEQNGGHSEFIRVGMEITLSHHERWDGGGYPDGLRGEEIPLSARIMALADVYDALRSRRVYKEGFSHEKTVEMMRKGRGSHFDPHLTDLFVENQEGFREIFDRSARQMG